MAVVTADTLAQAQGTSFLNELTFILGTDATVTNGTTSGTVTANLTEAGGDDEIALTGTNLNLSNGIVTSMTSSFDGAASITLSGLSISFTDLKTAVADTDPTTRYTEIAALFANIDWQIDFSGQTVGSLIYGSGGNDTITLGSGEDELMIDGGNDNLDAGGGNDLIYAGNLEYALTAGFSTVSGGDGSDTFCLDFREQGQTVDMFSSGQKITLGKLVIFGDTVIKLSDIENLRGSVYGDTLTGDDNPNTLTGEEGNDKLAGKGGVDTIFGGDGNDKITGGTDADLLRGNAGDDTFIYTAVAESAAKHDIIADFQHSHDQIDLSKLHPDTKDDKFIFIGDHNFGHHAGELEVVQHDNSGTANDFTMVLADLDGNGKADLQIELTHLVHLDKGDFIL